MSTSLLNGSNRRRPGSRRYSGSNQTRHVFPSDREGRSLGTRWLVGLGLRVPTRWWETTIIGESTNSMLSVVQVTRNGRPLTYFSKCEWSPWLTYPTFYQGPILFGDESFSNSLLPVREGPLGPVSSSLKPRPFLSQFGTSPGNNSVPFWVPNSRVWNFGPCRWDPETSPVKWRSVESKKWTITPTTVWDRVS